jgi:hypothetical protein
MPVAKAIATIISEQRATHKRAFPCSMSALGHKRTFRGVLAMSALPPKADIVGHDGDVRFVPKADSYTAA